MRLSSFSTLLTAAIVVGVSFTPLSPLPSPPLGHPCRGITANLLRLTLKLLQLDMPKEGEHAIGQRLIDHHHEHVSTRRPEEPRVFAILRRHRVVHRDSTAMTINLSRPSKSCHSVEHERLLAARICRRRYPSGCRSQLVEPLVLSAISRLVSAGGARQQICRPDAMMATRSCSGRSGNTPWTCVSALEAARLHNARCDPQAKRPSRCCWEEEGLERRPNDLMQDL